MSNHNKKLMGYNSKNKNSQIYLRHFQIILIISMVLGLGACGSVPGSRFGRSMKLEDGSDDAELSPKHKEGKTGLPCGKGCLLCKTDSISGPRCGKCQQNYSLRAKKCLYKGLLKPHPAQISKKADPSSAQKRNNHSLASSKEDQTLGSKNVLILLASSIVIGCILGGMAIFFCLKKRKTKKRTKKKVGKNNPKFDEYKKAKKQRIQNFVKKQSLDRVSENDDVMGEEVNGYTTSPPTMPPTLKTNRAASEIHRGSTIRLPEETSR